MTGKELMLALAGAGIVGGAAGAAASLVAAPRAEPAAQEASPETLHRLKIAEDTLAVTRTALEDSRKSVNELMERVTAAEISATKRAEADALLRAAAPAARIPHMTRRTHAADGTLGDLKDEARAVLDVSDLRGHLGEVELQLGEIVGDLALDGGAMPAGLSGLRAGLELRKLPEDRRWEKAKDDLGLTWNQVEDLKKAVADRDAAMKGAMTVEKKTSPGGGTITIQRPDAAKAAHAQADYHDRVNASLNEEQRKNWSSKGYENAFGGHPFGGGVAGSMVMAIDVTNDKEADAPKDAPK